MKAKITQVQLLNASLLNNERARLQAEAKKIQDAFAVLASAELQLLKSIMPEIDTEKQTLTFDAQTMTVECVDKPK